MDDWKQNLLDDDARIAELLRTTRRVAVLGVKTEVAAGQPAYDVPRFLQAAGLEIVPVPVYYPEAKEILGQPVFRKVADVPGTVDIVDVFRRPQDVPGHLDRTCREFSTPGCAESPPVSAGGLRSSNLACRNRADCSMHAPSVR